MTAAEEVRAIVTADEARSGGRYKCGCKHWRWRDGGIARTDDAGAPPRDTGPDPWQALVQVGAQLIVAVRLPTIPTPRRIEWTQRDPVTGAQNLKMPLPAPETARQLADCAFGARRQLAVRLLMEGHC